MSPAKLAGEELFTGAMAALAHLLDELAREIPLSPLREGAAAPIWPLADHV